MKRQVVFLMPGPLHLFWCTGVFYLWELAKRFQIILLVPENYKDNDQFNKILTCHFVEHVDYISSGRIASHNYCSFRLKELVTKYRPKFVFLHNESYMETQYLIHWCKKIVPECFRIYFQLGRMALSWEDDFLARDAHNMEQILKNRGLSNKWSWLAKMELISKKKLWLWFNYRIMPFLLIQHILRPPLNVSTGNFDNNVMEDLVRSGKDYWTAYLPIEIKAYEKLGYKNKVQISHPMKQSGKAVFEFIFGKLRVKKQILILPSYGFTSRLLTTHFSEQDVIDTIANKWSEAIDALGSRYPDHTFAMKLHPAAEENSIWQRIQRKIAGYFPSIVVLPATQSAEWHIVQSKVIVSDASTVLWWAALWGGKDVISLDIFGYPCGDELRFYDGIHYISSLEQLNDIRDKMVADAVLENGYPSMLDFVREIE